MWCIHHMCMCWLGASSFSSASKYPSFGSRAAKLHLPGDTAVYSDPTDLKKYFDFLINGFATTLQEEQGCSHTSLSQLFFTIFPISAKLTNTLSVQVLCESSSLQPRVNSSTSNIQRHHQA